MPLARRDFFTDIRRTDFGVSLRNFSAPRFCRRMKKSAAFCLKSGLRFGTRLLPATFKAPATLQSKTLCPTTFLLFLTPRKLTRFLRTAKRRTFFTKNSFFQVHSEKPSAFLPQAPPTPHGLLTACSWRGAKSPPRCKDRSK